MTTKAKVSDLKSPYPYMGGKARVAQMVWDRLGNVDNYVEPFMGSMAMLLKRPPAHFDGKAKKETVNDANHYVVNFARAVKHVPDAVAFWCDSPVMEADLHARHRWLVVSAQADEFRERMRVDPDYFDPKIAGWWCWGAACWIGGAWCNDSFVTRNAMPQIDAAHGVHRGPLIAQVPSLTIANGGHRSLSEQVPELSSGMGRGDAASHTFSQQVPELNHGRGVTSTAYDDSIPPGVELRKKKVPEMLGCRGDTTTQRGRPQLTDAYGIGGGGTRDARAAWLKSWMRELSDRLWQVRTLYGHWNRACNSDSTVLRLGTTGVFLDPPYPTTRADTGEKSRDAECYINDKTQDLDKLRDEVLEWCKEWGRHDSVRIALCCYEGDGYESLKDLGWEVVAWQAAGGYGNQRRKGGKKNANASRERIYFSPACIKPKTERDLFSDFDPNGETADEPELATA